MEQQKEEEYNAIVFDPTQPKEVLHQFRCSTFNFNYFNVLMFNKYIGSDLRKALLSIEYSQEFDEDYIKELHSYLNQSRFSYPYNDDVKDLLDRGDITIKEANEHYENNKKFCHLGDFDVIYSLFIEKWNINLIEDTITWFEYLFLLETIMLEDNALTKRIGYRSFEPIAGEHYTKQNEQGKMLKEKYSYYTPPEEDLKDGGDTNG